jgi:hypothetical protein
MPKVIKQKVFCNDCYYYNTCWYETCESPDVPLKFTYRKPYKNNDPSVLNKDNNCELFKPKIKEYLEEFIDIDIKNINIEELKHD